MSQKAWAILAILAAVVAVVFCALGLLLFAASTPSRTQVVIVDGTATPMSTSALRPTYTPQPIRLPTPTPTNIPKPIESDANVFLKEQQCISKGDTVLCLVVFYNPTDSIVGFVSTTFYFFDSDGVSLGSGIEGGAAYNLFPKEIRKTIVVFGLPDNTKLGKYEFDTFLSKSQSETAGITQNPFTVSGVQTQGNSVVAIIANSSDKTFDSVEVEVILYDRNGAFVGGGITFSPLLPARGKARVEVDMSSMYGVFGDVSKIEVYPSIGGITSVK